MKIIICLLCMVVNGLAQTSIPDSLKKIALRVSKDSAAKLYVRIANIYTGVNSDSVRKYALIADKMAPVNSMAKGDVLVQLGNSYHMENKIDSALSYFNKALIYYTKIGSDKGVGKVYQSFAIVKRSLGDFEGCVEDSKKALKIYKEIKWQLGIVNVSTNISHALTKMNKDTEALKYMREAFSLSKQLGDSLKYYIMMSEYGGKFAFGKNVDSAIYYINTARPFLERNQMYNTLIPAYNNLANAIYVSSNGDLNLAKEALYKAKYYSFLSGATDNLRYIYRDMASVYIKEKNADSAQFYVDKTFNFIDSTNIEEGLQMSKEIEAKYETEKKELQLQKQAVEISAKQKENDAKNRLLIFSCIGLVAIGIFAFFAFKNYLAAKRSNVIIQKQKEQVEIQKEEISVQKELVETKQKEIIDSINYAKRIQQAVLTGEEVWNKISKEHFILFKPKDIVSGDFYWAYNTPNGRSVFALADCTGHGVPGGFMSMLGNSFLNEIVVDNKLFKANEILNKLREKIIAALEQEGHSEQKDGMDISLCVWNKMDNTLEFAGANNPLWILSGGEFIEYKADKMPIGTYTETAASFSSHSIQLQKGDIIYLITDGFADQFGGPKGKKFKYKPLQDLLFEHKNKPMSHQKELLDKALTEWKENYEQVDDISLIGVRV